MGFILELIVVVLVVSVIALAYVHLKTKHADEDFKSALAEHLVKINGEVHERVDELERSLESTKIALALANNRIGDKVNKVVKAVVDKPKR